MTTATPAPESASSYPHPFRILLGPLITSFVGLYSEAALNIALPNLMVVFGVGASVIQWMTTGYILAVGIVLPLFGLAVRWFSTRQLAFGAIGLFVLGAVVCGLAPDFGMLLTGRIIQGVATGVCLPLIFNTAVAVYPQRRIGTAMGVIGMVVMFAPAVSPVVAGVIVEYLSWRWIFWSMIPVLLVALAVALPSLQNVRKRTRPRVDAASVALSTIGFGALVFGVSIGGDTQWSTPEAPVALVVGVAGIAAFAWRQLRIPEPILDVRAFQHSLFTLSTVVIVVNNALLMCAIFLIPMYLQDARGVTVLAAGLLMLPGGVVNGVLSAASGRLSDSLPPKALILGGLIVSIVASGVFVLLGTDTALGLVVLAHCLLMIGVPLTATPAQTLGLRSLPQRLSSDGSTIISTLQQIGAAIGTALGASLLSAGQTAAGGTGTFATAQGTRWGFAFCLGCALTALLVALFLRRPRSLTGSARGA